MIVYTRTVIDIETLEIMESSSFDYYGSVTECGGGGGSSGKVGYPEYLQGAHDDWLSHDEVDGITSSMTDITNSALGSSPYTGASVFDPDTDITAMLAKIASTEAVVNALDEDVDWAAYLVVAQAAAWETPAPAAAAEIAADVTAFGNELDTQLAATVFPRFEAGMRDINAVVSSAFVIGRALIEEQRNLEVAKYQSGLRTQAYLQRDNILADGVKDRNKLATIGASQMLTSQVQRVQFQVAVTNSLVETRRIKIVAKMEQADGDLDIDVKDATWDLSVFQYGANLMAAPGGGTGVPGDHRPGKTQSTIGGAMAGAAVGATYTGTPQGAVVGAVIGGVAGYLSAS